MTDDVRFFDDLPDAAKAVALLRDIEKMKPALPHGKIDKPLYLYGAGSLGRLAWDYFKKVGVSVAGVIDKNAVKARQDPFWNGVPVVNPEEVPEDVKKDILLAVCVVTSPWGEVTHPLRADGWQDIVPFYTVCASYLDKHPLDNGWLTGPLTPKDVSEIENVLSCYADDISRAHHLMFLAWHCLQEEWIFKKAPVTLDDRFFIPEIVSKLHDRESFADLGAHHGNVILKFLGTVKSKFTGVTAFEPDAENAKELRKTVDQLPSDVKTKIRIEEKILGRTSGKANFESGLGYASRIVKQGGTQAPVFSLDEFNLSPSFIKAHLEGGELDALLGGLRTIRRHKPIVALTVYHDREGLWGVQKGLKDALSGEGYRFIFRQHGWQGTGGVLYLIPETRE
ncbi:MAG: FkbM family methyltransferase [Bdellovibrionales bacterium]